MENITIPFKCDDNKEQIKKILLDNISNVDPLFMKKVTKKKVLIKPNIAGPFTANMAATTSINLTRAMAEIVIESGGKVVVGDIPTTGYKALEINGLDRLIHDLPVEMLKSEYKNVQINDMKLDIAMELLTCDYFISLPKIKTHILTGFTGAIKNTFGLVAPYDRKRLHLTSDIKEFCNVLFNIYSIRTPDLVIADGILAMEGIGPTHGNPRQCSTLLLGNNGIMLDDYIAALMGYEANKLVLLREAKLRDNYTIQIECLPQDIVVLWKNYLKVPMFEGEKRIRFLHMALGTLKVDENKCKQCKVCENVCPAKAIDISKAPPFDFEKCVLCFCCLEMCPFGAIITQKRI